MIKPWFLKKGFELVNRYFTIRVLYIALSMSASNSLFFFLVSILIKLIKARKSFFREGLEVTDDVSIVEHLKHPVYITEGSYTNIKVIEFYLLTLCAVTRLI